VVQNYAAPQGVIYLDKRRYAETFGPQPVEQVALWLRAGTSPGAAIRAIEALPGSEAALVVSNAAVRRDALRVFDRTFAITDLLGSLAALVAFVAVVSALTALLEERTRTLGFLRAIGVSRRRLGFSLGLEALLLAAVSAVVSWGAGLGMAVVLVFVINRRAFGWSLQFLPGQGRYGLLLALALASALLGSLYPILRATRLSIVATIRGE
jgi:putative ABC transport system permease protein